MATWLISNRAIAVLSTQNCFINSEQPDVKIGCKYKPPKPCWLAAAGSNQWACLERPHIMRLGSKSLCEQ